LHGTFVANAIYTNVPALSLIHVIVEMVSNVLFILREYRVVLELSFVAVSLNLLYLSGEIIAYEIAENCCKCF